MISSLTPAPFNKGCSFSNDVLIIVGDRGAIRVQVIYGINPLLEALKRKDRVVKTLVVATGRG